MNITLFPPLAFTQPGQRENNEDSVCPAVGTADSSSRVFVVCDGVGGGASGEIASRIVADGMVAYFDRLTGPSNEETVAEALRSVEQALDAYLAEQPDAAGMATTLTLLHLHEQGATVAHVGDSRVYCCREGRVAFQTDDHKLVNEWVANGILTSEQAADHPQRNVITRAVRGSEKPAQADVALLMGLRADDYFFLCTDGVLENLTSEELCAILATTKSDRDKLATIRQCSDGRTNDNYSAYLVHIQSVEVALEEVSIKEEPTSQVQSQVTTITSTEPVLASVDAGSYKPLSKPVDSANRPGMPTANTIGSMILGPLATRSLGKWRPYLLIALLVGGIGIWFVVSRQKMTEFAKPLKLVQAPSGSHLTMPVHKPHQRGKHHPAVN